MTYFRTSFYLSAPLLALLLTAPVHTLASTFAGGTLEQGLIEAEKVRLDGHEGTNIRDSIWNTVLVVLSYMGLAAVTVICIAGIFLILGFGNDQSRERAQKIIFWSLIGMIVIALSSAFVRFVIQAGIG